MALITSPGCGFFNITQSIIKIATDIISEAMDSGYSRSLTFVNLDAVADVKELPDGDILGVGGFSVINSDEMQSVICHFGISTRDDKNLFRMYGLMDFVYQRLLPGQMYFLYNQETAQHLARMIIDTPTTISPVVRSETRTVQYIELVFQSPLIAKSPEIF